MNALRILLGWLDRLSIFSNFIAMVSIGLMSILIIVEVAGRLFFNFSTLISEEWSSYLLIYLIFFGIANTFRSNAFITVDIIYNHLSQRVREKLRFYSIILAFLFVFILDYELITFVLSSYKKHLKSISFSETPLVIPQIAMPIGASLLGLQLLKDLIERILSRQSKTQKR